MGLMDSARGRLHLCDRMLLGQHGFVCPKPSLGEVLARCIQLVVKLRPIVDERSVGNDRPTVCIRLRRSSAVCQAGNRFRVMVGRLPESQHTTAATHPWPAPDGRSLPEVGAPRQRAETQAISTRSGGPGLSVGVIENDDRFRYSEGHRASSSKSIIGCRNPVDLRNPGQT